jgi:hypothetical protein
MRNLEGGRKQSKELSRKQARNLVKNKGGFSREVANKARNLVANKLAT